MMVTSTSPKAGPPRVKGSVDTIAAEIHMIQERLRAYDDLIWKNRGWAITLLAAFIGWGLSRDVSESKDLILRGAFTIPAAFLLLEVLVRWFYAYRFAHRYRVLRDSLHGTAEFARPIEEISPFDLAGELDPPTRRTHKFLASVCKGEMWAFYLVLAILSAVAWGW